MKPVGTFWIAISLVLAAGLPSQAQKQADIKPEPVATGYTSFVSTFETGKQKVVPQINPILVVPLGDRWLIEAEFEFEGEFEREKAAGMWNPWERMMEREIEYLQVDFLAHRYLTLVAGRFLTPFGIFNERLHPKWIRKLQPKPLIAALGIGTGSGNGVMLRGGARVASGVNLNYTGYFSTLLMEPEGVESDRMAGTRLSLFFPNQRVEVGSSFGRFLQDERFNTYGFDATWQLKPVPLDFRVEYAQSEQGTKGYWVEGAYRFQRKAEVVGRMEQLFVRGPGGDKQRPMVGFNYYFRDGFHINFAYGREFRTGADRNISSLGMAYRWVF